MKNLSSLKIMYLLISIIVFLIIVFVLILFLQKPTPSSPFKTSLQEPTPVIVSHPTPLSTSFDQTYNNFTMLKPGKNNLAEIEKLNGPAISSVKNDNKLYLYYQTPSTDYKNIVVLKDGLLYYSVENVFGEYRGNYLAYIARYGQPDLHLYNNTAYNHFDWYIFLKTGVGIENSYGGITRILYFSPVLKQEFMNSLAKELELVNTPPTFPSNGY
jgi:hypothetical protein